MGIMTIISEGLRLINGLLGRVWKSQDNVEKKKELEKVRDTTIINDNERIVENAHKTNSLEEIRRRASE
jgi:hypothetical protein